MFGSPWPNHNRPQSSIFLLFLDSYANERRDLNNKNGITIFDNPKRAKVNEAFLLSSKLS